MPPQVKLEGSAVQGKCFDIIIRSTNRHGTLIKISYLRHVQ